MHRAHGMISPVRTARASVIAILVTAPFGAFAEAQPAYDEAAALTLYKSGIDAMLEKRYAAACPLLEQSRRAQPTPWALFASGECEAELGKRAVAFRLHEAYLDLEKQLPQKQRAKEAERVSAAMARLNELRPHVARVTITLPPEAPEGARVTLDGTELKRTDIGVAQAIEPGEHVVVVELAGGVRVRERFTIEREEERKVSPSIEDPPFTSPAKEKMALGPASTRAATPPSVDSGAGPWRTGAIIAGSVGLAGLGLGAVTGGLAWGRKSDIEAHCDGALCDVEGKSAAEKAQALGAVSTIGFGVGIAGLVTGTVMLVMDSSGLKRNEAKRGLSPEVMVAGSRSATLGLKGVW